MTPVFRQSTTLWRSFIIEAPQNIREDRLPELTDEQRWALPDDFDLRQWGLVVSDEEIEKSLAIYISLYFIEIYEMAPRACSIFETSGIQSGHAAWLAGIECLKG